MDTSKMIKAYCLKTKEKNVPMMDAVITKTAKGGYMAGGHDDMITDEPVKMWDDAMDAIRYATTHVRQEYYTDDSYYAF